MPHALDHPRARQPGSAKFSLTRWRLRPCDCGCSIIKPIHRCTIKIHAMNQNEDLYEILQVHHAAEPEVIEAAYRRLLRMYHPDVNKTAQAHQITVRLNNAYEVLRDPAKRTDYDRQRDSQTHSDHRKQEWQAEQERQERAERQRQERQAQAERERRAREERERREREAQAERERQEYREWERQAQERVRTEQQQQGRAEHGRRAYEERDEKTREQRQEKHATKAKEDGNRAFILTMAVSFSVIISLAAWALIPNRADVNAEDNNDYLPLHIAASKGQTQTALSLISDGADVNAKALDIGITPLHIAVFQGQTETASVLISAGADFEATYDEGYKPLYLAASGGHTEMVLALISAGADVNAKDNDGYTPLDIATAKGHNEIVEVISNAGGKKGK